MTVLFKFVVQTKRFYQAVFFKKTAEAFLIYDIILNVHRNAFVTEEPLEMYIQLFWGESIKVQNVTLIWFTETFYYTCEF